MKRKSKSKKVKSPIENIIFKAIIGKCEEIENLGQYNGNGQHLAQKLTTLVAEGLLSKQQRIIYDMLTKTPTYTIEIAKGCKLSSKLVSSQLKQIQDSTQLVLSKDDGGKKMWYRAY